jgi:hypothetical protein
MKELIESIGNLVTSILSVIFLGDKPDDPRPETNKASK